MRILNTTAVSPWLARGKAWVLADPLRDSHLAEADRFSRAHSEKMRFPEMNDYYQDSHPAVLESAGNESDTLCGELAGSEAAIPQLDLGRCTPQWRAPNGRFGESR
jgi:hypothetical protein